MVQRFLDATVRHHLAADLAETREPIRDRHEAVLVDDRDVAGHVPTVDEHLLRQVRASEIAREDVGSAHEEHAASSHGTRFVRLGIDDAHGDARQRLTDTSAAMSALENARSAHGEGARGDHGGTFGRAVTFDRSQPESLLEGGCEALWKSFRTGHHESKSTELFGRDALRIEGQEGRCGEQHRRAVRLGRASDRVRVEW